MDKQQILEAIKKRSQDDKIGCRQCFEVAKECDVSLKIVGDTCDQNQIKIHACQLGCFK